MPNLILRYLPAGNSPVPVSRRSGHRNGPILREQSREAAESIQKVREALRGEQPQVAVALTDADLPLRVERPNGSVLVVKRVKWRDIIDPADWPAKQPTRGEIVAAHNRKHAA